MRQHQSCWDAPLELDSKASSHPIQVFVRVRPLLERDVESGAFSLVMVQPPRTVHFTHPTNRWTGGCFATKTYDADGVFDEETNNDTVYNGLGLQEMIKQALSEPGHEFCVMAYGQTGTGKTYTTTAIEGVDPFRSSWFASTDLNLHVLQNASRPTSSRLCRKPTPRRSLLLRSKFEGERRTISFRSLPITQCRSLLQMDRPPRIQG